VPAKAQRRRFTAEYKREVLAQADACREAGEIGALLRREGLYTSHLSAWRQQRDAGALASLGGRRRGRKPLTHPMAKRLAVMEQENARLREELRKAHVIIDVQKKVSRLLGLPPSEDEAEF